MVDWVTAMDMCASQGIIDYDAPAAILGQNPRYYGRPDMEKIPSLYGLQSDVYDTNNGDLVRPKTWKRNLAKALIGVGAIAGILTLIQKGKLNISKIKAFGSGVCDKVGKLFKK
jgi:hypothetical protein